MENAFIRMETFEKGDLESECRAPKPKHLVASWIYSLMSLFDAVKHCQAMTPVYSDFFTAVTLLFRVSCFVTLRMSLVFCVCKCSQAFGLPPWPSLALSQRWTRTAYCHRRLQGWNVQRVNSRNGASDTHAFHSRDTLVKSQLQGKYHQRNQIYKQITAQDVILVDQRGLSSPSLNNAILPWPVGTGGRPFEI